MKEEKKPQQGQDTKGDRQAAVNPSSSQPEHQSTRIGTEFPMRQEHKGHFAASDTGDTEMNETFERKSSRVYKKKDRQAAVNPSIRAHASAQSFP